MTRDSDTTEHFVAHLKIERVEKGKDRNTPGKVARTTDEITQMTVKAPNLNDLIYKLRAHMGIIGDTDDGDMPFRPGVETSKRAEFPHSRDCGPVAHDHGTACSNNCPSCGGSELA